MRITRKHAIWGVSFLAMMGIAGIQKSCEDNRQREYQRKIEKADPKRYKRIVQQDKINYLSGWRKEYFEMKDSLRADSFYKEGFKAGQQSIRDSLKSSL